MAVFLGTHSLFECLRIPDDGGALDSWAKDYINFSHDKLYFLRLWPTDSSTPAPWRLHTKPYKMLKTSSFRSFLQRPGENCGLILLAGWIALKVFLFCPLTIYVTNAEEMQVGFHSLVFLYLIPFLVSAAILVFSGLALPAGPRRCYVAILAAIGGLLWLQGDVLLWSYGSLDGSFIDWRREAWKGYVDSSIWLAVLVAAVYWRRHLVPRVRSGVLLLLAIQLGSLLFMNPWAALVKKPQPSMLKLDLPDRLVRFSGSHNVIHIVLDGFQSDVFEELVEGSERYRENFRGFTFFREATTSTRVTHLSIPSFISASTYRNQIPAWKYKRQIFKGKNILKTLADAGYQIDLASGVSWLSHLHSGAMVYGIPHPFREKAEIERWHAAFLLDLSLFRLAPHFIKREIYNQQAWLISSMNPGPSGTHYKHFSDNEFFRRFTEESSLGRETPVYKLIHLLTPHPPLVVDERNLPARTPLKNTRENFRRQSADTLEWVLRFLDKLRKLSIYDDSTIIIQADHGSGLSFQLQDRTGQWIDSRKSSLRISGAVLPLFLVKPALSKGVLRVSDAQVELNDLPATIVALLGLPGEFGGKNIFEVKSGERRDRRYNRGMVNRDTSSKTGFFTALQEYVISGSVFVESSWRKGTLYQKPAEHRDTDYPWGTLLTFGRSGNVHRFLLDGWSVPSESERTTWTRADEARLSFRISPPKRGRVFLSVKATPFVVKEILPRQRVLIHVNDQFIGEWVLAERALRSRSIEVPANFFRDREVVIGFKFPDAATPREMGVNRDVRTLAVRFASISLHDGPAS